MEIPIKAKMYLVINDAGKIYKAFPRKLTAEVYISGFREHEKMAIVEGYFMVLKDTD